MEEKSTLERIKVNKDNLSRQPYEMRQLLHIQLGEDYLLLAFIIDLFYICLHGLKIRTIGFVEFYDELSWNVTEKVFYLKK